MSLYNTILVAIDLNEDADKVIQKAQKIRLQNNATLTIIHVAEPLSYAYGGDIPMDLSDVQNQLHEDAKRQMHALVEQHKLGEVTQLLVSGHIQTEVHKLATKFSTDLVIVGSHGRHGLALLLGSTSSSILHGATCDVLAVRV